MKDISTKVKDGKIRFWRKVKCLAGQSRRWMVGRARVI